MNDYKVKIVKLNDPVFRMCIELCANQYKQTYKTDNVNIYDSYLALTKCVFEDGRFKEKLISCAGFRKANSKYLYSEAYMDAPIESVISSMENESISRDVIFEVGSFTSINSSGALELIKVMNYTFWALGLRYALITGVPYIISALKRINMNVNEICCAETDEATMKKWGNVL